MRSDDIRPNGSRPHRHLPLSPVTGPAPLRDAERITRDRDDYIRIADDDRARAAQQQADLAAAGDALSPDRVAELRRWVQAGSFDEPDVAEQVAMRLLARGEIQRGR